MSRRRFHTHYAANAEALGLAADHPAVIEGRSIFPSRVVDLNESPRLLVSGVNQRKLGSHVTKGRWRDMPIFALTLEERATCPRSCHHWRDCYGNNSHMSRRHKHGADLEIRLAFELAQKQREFPTGFVVRLHQLGDFYDEAYAMLWHRWVRLFPALRIFGYTARSPVSVIGAVVGALNVDFPDRAWMRFSVLEPVRNVMCAVTIATAETPVDGIVCPAQTGKTACCATCALCWTTEKTIAFLQHGGFSGGRRSADERDPDVDFDEGEEDDGAPVWRPARVAGTAQRVAATEAPSAPVEVPSQSEAVSDDTPQALREIELRAWLRRVVGAEADVMSSKAALAVANLHRTKNLRPPFRLIPGRRQYAETIFA
jgi:hypothetical protein